MASTLFLDLETYSAVPIAHGTHAYATSAEILLFAYAVDNEPIKVWDCTDGTAMPRYLLEALSNHELTLCAHNAHFDRTILRHKGYNLPICRWRCTMAQALAHSLPGSLAALCETYKLLTDTAKHKDGKRLIQLFCQPQPSNRKVRRATSATHPEDWDAFVAYAQSDIAAMRALDAIMPAWNFQGGELALWHLDQKINDRGFAVDTELARAAIKAAALERARLAHRTNVLTNGAVQAATQRDALLKYLATTFNTTLSDLKQASVKSHIANSDYPDALRELLSIRLRSSSTSIAKYQTLIKVVSSDDRLRGTLQFCGAGRTGRWAGRLFQPQNLPRSTLAQQVIDEGIAALKNGDGHSVTSDVIALCSSAVRGCIVAPKNKKLVIADLANIEGRVLAWLAGEDWKVQAFRDFDAGDAPDIYKLAYAKSFGIRPEYVTKEQRQIGKVQELALGYGGGVGAFAAFAAAYDLDLEEMGRAASDRIPTRIKLKAMQMLNTVKAEKRPTHELSDIAWVVCDSFKRMWREAHPKTVAFWRRLEEAARHAVALSGNTLECLKLKVRCDGAWLRIRLPSGRYLCYPTPRIDSDKKLSYEGVGQFSRKWGRLHTYGGKLCENATQAVSRDVLASTMQKIEAAGYQIVLSVHDELLTEADDNDSYSAEHLSALMTAKPEWAEGLPLAAAGFEAHRYRKE